MQFLSKTVSGVIHTIKDALPTFDDGEMGSGGFHSLGASINGPNGNHTAPAILAPRAANGDAVGNPLFVFSSSSVDGGGGGGGLGFFQRRNAAANGYKISNATFSFKTKSARGVS